MIAALMDDEDDGNKLQDAAKNLADAFSNLLKAAHGSPGAPDNVSSEACYSLSWVDFDFNHPGKTIFFEKVQMAQLVSVLCLSPLK